MSRIRQGTYYRSQKTGTLEACGSPLHMFSSDIGSLSSEEYTGIDSILSSTPRRNITKYLAQLIINCVIIIKDQNIPEEELTTNIKQAVPPRHFGGAQLATLARTAREDNAGD